VKKVFSTAGLCLLMVGCNADRSGTAETDRDNTAINQRDADDRTVTPMDQSNDSAEIDRVAEIRRAVLDIDDLSSNGQNVKIVTDNGKVVLRGPVASIAERDAIGKVAESLAGAGNVTNQLEIEPN